MRHLVLDLIVYSTCYPNLAPSGIFSQQSWTRQQDSRSKRSITRPLRMMLISMSEKSSIDYDARCCLAYDCKYSTGRPALFNPPEYLRKMGEDE